jgi:hypothetical protein
MLTWAGVSLIRIQLAARGPRQLAPIPDGGLPTSKHAVKVKAKAETQAPDPVGLSATKAAERLAQPQQPYHTLTTAVLQEP